MRGFFTFLLQKLWALVVVIVAAWIPWVLNIVVKDSFKATVKAVAENSKVSASAYQLISMAASYPVAACLLLSVFVVCGGAIFSAVEARKAMSSAQPSFGEKNPNKEIESNTVEELTQQAKEWRKKWEDERGGSSARDQIIENNKGEIKKLVEGLESCRTQLDRKIVEAENGAKLIATAQEAHNSVWYLKAAAREIKRRWPDADFLDRPANKSLWVKERQRSRPYRSVGQPEWMDAAIRWHEKLWTSPIMQTIEEAYLNSLSFDDLMEFLDAYEQCRIAGRAVPLRKATGNIPYVGIANFGLKVIDHRGEHFGVFVRNYNQPAAFRVRIAPFRIGQYRLSFDVLDSLLMEHNDVFVEGLVQEPGGGQVIHADLFTLLGEREACLDDGFVPLVVNLSFADSSEKKYICRHEVRRSPTATQTQNIEIQMFTVFEETQAAS